MALFLPCRLSSWFETRADLFPSPGADLINGGRAGRPDRGDDGIIRVKQGRLMKMKQSSRSEDCPPGTTLLPKEEEHLPLPGGPQH